ncbi:MAG: glycosidase [Chloroflexi bacterium]|nr:glycosidase [Chloroflexota bacterium]
MAQAAFHFPRGFLWGTATASHQVEGSNTNNNWWAWENEPGRILNGQKAGLACDWWSGRWREDFDRAADAGQNAHRMSIEWSRIQPRPGIWDESALDRYRDIVRGMVERGMTPLITLHHFSDPLWLVEQGGWENEAVAERFETYARKVVEALKEYVTLWATINEPNVYAVMGYIVGNFPPGKTSINAGLNVMTNMVLAHARAYRAIHAIQPQARVGLALNVTPMIPAKSWSPLDRVAVSVLRRVYNEFFPAALSAGKLRYPTHTRRIPEAKNTQDYFGMNYYTRFACAVDLRMPRQKFIRYAPENCDEISETGFIGNDPAGFYAALEWAKSFGLPIIVTENGVEDSNDNLRPRYLVQHIHQLWRAVNIGIPIKGYFHWTLVDNFEWERGWSQRFGLWELDVETQARRKRPSADLYAEICQENGLSSEMVARYTPQLFEQIFPN